MKEFPTHLFDRGLGAGAVSSRPTASMVGPHQEFNRFKRETIQPPQPIAPKLTFHPEMSPGPVLYNPKYYWATIVIDWQFQTSDLFMVVVDLNQQQNGKVKVVWSAGGPNQQDPLGHHPFVGYYYSPNQYELGPELTQGERQQTGLGAGPHGGGGHHGGGGGGHHHGGGHGHFIRGGRFHRFRGGFPAWGWGPEIIVVGDRGCTWAVSSVTPIDVIGALSRVAPSIATNDTRWRQTYVNGAWWAAHSAGDILDANTIYYICEG